MKKHQTKKTNAQQKTSTRSVATELGEQQKQGPHRQYWLIGLFLGLILITSSCSVIEQIAEFNVDKFTAEGGDEQKQIQTLPESDYVKNGIEVGINYSTTFNPLDSIDYTVIQFLQLVYQPLFELNQHFELTPVLAESYELIEGNTYRVSLKKGILFHDQTELTADDVVFSFYYLKQHSDFYGYAAGLIEEIRKQDANTLQVKFYSNHYYNQYGLIFPIISQKYVSSKQYDPKHPIGTGGYQFHSLKRMLQLKLEKTNLNLTDSADFEPLPLYFTGLIVRDQKELHQMHLSKRVDLYAPRITYWNQFANDQSIETHYYSSPYFYYIGINHQVLDSVQKRDLVARSIPYDSIKKDVFLGHLEQVTLPILPGSHLAKQMEPELFNYQAESVYRSQYIEPTDKKPVLRNQQKLRLIYNRTNFYQTKIAEITANKWPTDQVQPELVGLDTEAYKVALQNRDYDLFVGVIRTGFINDLASIYTTEGSLNFSKYSNPAIDMKLTGYLQFAEKQLVDVHNELCEEVINDLPLIPLGYLQNSLFSTGQIQAEYQPNFTNVYHNYLTYRIKKDK